MNHASYVDWEQDASDEEDEASEQESSDEEGDANQQDNYEEDDQTGLMEGVVGQRQCLFTKLLRALWPPSARKKSTSLGTFAACEAVRYAEGFILPSFHVEGVGELQLPLSTEGATKLRSACEAAPFGIQGSATSVRRCWQMDASKVSFPGAPAFLSTTVQAMAVKAVKELGLDGEGAQLEATLSKLLLYEAGGRFSFHSLDTEKEKRMLATLILQLPTDEGYKGGKLVVLHDTKQKEFDCHMVSALGFCYTVSFADCLHEVQEIKSGTKLCLVFSLVKRDCSLDPRHREYISSRVSKVEDALRPWLKEATSRTMSPAIGPKLAIPLRFKYTKENLSFAGLKGEDNIVAELLKDCRDENNERWLDVHLVLATKQVTEGENDEEETVTYQKWTAVDDTPVRKAFEKLGVDIENEAVLDVGRVPFGNKPDEKDYLGYRGRSELWYYKAMLVVWPKTLSISVACQAGVSGALDLLESTGHPSLKDGLHQIISFCESDASMEENWFAERTGSQDSKVDPITPRLLDLCIRAGMLAYVLRVFQVLVKTISYKPRYESTEKSFKVGVRNMEVASRIVSAVQAFGWPLLSSHVINMASECALAQGESFALLAKQLIITGNADAGVMVAEATFRVFETLIAELDSQKMPEFSWHQPDAKIPGYPELLPFLRGPEEKYVYRGVKGLPAMRAFASECLNRVNYTAATWGYSATGTPDGKGQGVFCVIQKTRDVYDKSVAHWRQEQERLNRLRLELKNLRSVVPPTNPSNVTTFGESSERKRETEDVDLAEDTRKRAKSSATNAIDLDLCL